MLRGQFRGSNQRPVKIQSIGGKSTALAPKYPVQVDDLVTNQWWWWTHVAATWALVGLIWVVQQIIYPMMAEWSRDRFSSVHAGYTRRMGAVVAPLMLVELLGAVAWVWVSPEDGLAWTAGALVAVTWLSTGLMQVPLHKRLESGFSADVIAKLVRTNWIRTWAWTLRGVILVGLIVN